MAQRSSQIPKFGNWDDDNIPYTAYFENARKEKGGMRMNPNDPEENPEAFMFGTGSSAVDRGDERSDKWIPLEKQNLRGHKRESSRGSVTSKSGSEKSSSDHSRRQPIHHQQQQIRSDYNKRVPSESSTVSSPPRTRLPGHSRQGSGSQPAIESHRRAVSIPKFGAWDETDPRSGESFTVIFNRVKEEKQIASSKFPTVQPEPIRSFPCEPKKKDSSSLCSKICCCLFSK